MSCFGVGLSYVDGKVGANVSGIFGVVGAGMTACVMYS